jgi:hypothetical protein
MVVLDLDARSTKSIRKKGIMRQDQRDCPHAWVAGMMYVHPEDLDYVAKVREVECEKCELIYQSRTEGNRGDQDV